MRACLLVSLLVVAGCMDSPRSRFFTIGSIPRHAVLAYDGPAVGLDELVLPTVLDHTTMVVHETGTRVAVRDSDRWAGPLDELVRDALAANLAARLPPERVLTSGQPLGADPTRRLDLVFHRFIAGPGPSFQLTGTWSLRQEDRLLLNRNVELTVPLASLDSEHIAAGASRALALLADDLASAIVACSVDDAPSTDAAHGGLRTARGSPGPGA